MPHLLSPTPPPHQRKDLIQISEMALGEHNLTIPNQKTFKINFFEYQISHFFWELPFSAWLLVC